MKSRASLTQFNQGFESHVASDDYSVVVNDDRSEFKHLREVLNRLAKVPEIGVFDNPRVCRIDPIYQNPGTINEDTGMGKPIMTPVNEGWIGIRIYFRYIPSPNL